MCKDEKQAERDEEHLQGSPFHTHPEMLIITAAHDTVDYTHSVVVYQGHHNLSQFSCCLVFNINVSAVYFFARWC